MSISPRHRRRATLASAAFITGGMLLAGPAALASAAPDPDPTPAAPAAAATPDYSIGGFLSNAGKFAGTLGTNVNQFVGVGGTNLNQFVGTLGTNGLVFAGTLGNNLVGNPPNAGGSGAASAVRLATANRMKVSAQCNSNGRSSCSN